MKLARVGSIKRIGLSELELGGDVHFNDSIYGLDHRCSVFGGLRNERCCLGWVRLVGWVGLVGGARLVMVRVDRFDVGRHIW